jgi:parallel beta-helix repeat protein
LRKTFVGLFLLLILSCIFALLSKIQPTKASNLPIYILPNGIVNGTSSIHTSDNVTYFLTANINNQSVIVERNNTLIDGNGHTVQGELNSGYGITLSSINNVTLENTTITDFQYGIYLRSSSHVNLLNNNVTHNYYGIYLISSPATIMRNNKMTSNTCNLAIFGLQLSEYTDSIYASNLINGRPTYFYVDQSGLLIKPSTYPSVGYLALINCTNITIENLTLTNNGQGVLLVNTRNSTITKNNLTNNIAGIDLENSQRNKISANNVTANSYWGISSHYSSCNTLSDNNASGNGYDGVGLYFSANNTVSDNTASQNADQGIELYSCLNNTVSGNIERKNNLNGIDLDNSTYNSILYNTLSENFRSGIDLDFYSKNNTVSSNNIAENSVGIWVSLSSNNTIYDNNIINNTRQVDSEGLPNSWDHNARGNYWSDYTNKYPNASERDTTGTWNTSYVIDANNIDHYPLMNQIVIPEFQPFVILPLFMLVTLLAVAISGEQKSGIGQSS